MKVKVHFNLHKNLWSITARSGKDAGRVIAHVKECSIINPVFKVADGKYNKCHSDNKRHVCAWIFGDLDLEFSPVSGGRRISYNPFKSHDFYWADTQETVTGNLKVMSFKANGIDRNTEVLTK